MKVADPERNADATLDFAARAVDGGAQVVVFPELGLTGYTCGDLFFSLTTLVAGAERALERVLRETAGRPTVLVLGLPVLQGGRLFNAAAVVQSGRILGVVPKTFLPGYKEYYEERWFSSAREAREGEVRLAGQAAPFGTDLLFQLPEDPGVTLAVEICEDLWAPIPPSSRHAVAGATVLLNPSASNDLVAKAEYRRELVRQQSGRTLSAYVYANAGVHESTTDLVFGGPPPGRRERRPPRRGRTLPPRRRAPGDRRGRGAAAGRARAPDLLCRRRPHGRPGLPDGRARPGARTAAPPPRADDRRRTRSSPPTRRRSTSGAARSSRSRPPASPAASSTWG